MSRTEVDGDQIADGTIQRKDLDSNTVGQSVIKKFLIAGTGFQVTHTGADSGTGDVELSLDAGGFGTDYYAFQSVSLSQTTSNNWVEKALFTTPIVDAGKYIVHYKAQLTNSQKKQVGFQANYIEDGGPAVEIEASFNLPTSQGIFETRTGFEEVTVSANGTIGIQINWGQTTSGGQGQIQKVAVYIFKVGEL